MVNTTICIKTFVYSKDNAHLVWLRSIIVTIVKRAIPNRYVKASVCKFRCRKLNYRPALHRITMTYLNGHKHVLNLTMQQIN